jgi:AraC-like DNA-binding protein
MVGEVIQMQRLDSISVEDVETLTVEAEKGRHVEIRNRSTFGLSFCKSGKITYTHKGKKFLSTPDRAVFLPQGASYELYNDQGGEFPVLNFTCAEPFTDEFLVIPLTQTEEYFSDYEKMRYLEATRGSRLKRMSLFYGILARLVHESKSQNPHLAHATQFIFAHLADPKLSNDRIASAIDISEVYLRRLFRENYKTTPKQYIIETRLKKAEQFLQENRLSVTEIALQCGFSSVYHFCRSFKQFANLTPSEYRKRYRAQGI